MARRRVLIRFRKEGDLRFISHRDLVRTLERLFRRCGLVLQMSEGFHPKPRMSFPAALALGMIGAREAMLLELAEERSAAEIADLLATECPPGLRILEVSDLPEGRKPRAVSMSYEVEIPAERCAVTAQRVAQWWSSAPVGEGDTAEPDAWDRTEVQQLELVERVLHLRLRVNAQGGARPRAVLTALGLEDLEQLGASFTRSDIELQVGNEPVPSALRGTGSGAEESKAKADS